MKKHRLLISIIITTLLMVSFAFAACAPQTPTAPTTPTQPTTPTTPPPKPVELKLASMHAPGAPPGLQIERWAEKIAKDSNGLLTIRHYGASTLIAGPDMRIGIKQGTADIGNSFIYKPDPGFEVGQYHTQLVRGLSTEDGLKIMDDIWKKFPDLMAGQWKDYKVIWIITTHPTILYTVKKPVRKLEDLKGLQIRVPNAIIADFMKNLGATPVAMSTPDWITSLDKGTTDGGATTIGSMYDFKIADKFKYATFFAMGNSTNFTIMNKDSWNNLSPEFQKIIDNSLEWARQDCIKTWVGSEKTAIDFSKEKGIEFIYLSKDEYKKWDAAIKPVYDKIASDLNALKYPGTELVNYAMERSAFYSIR